MYPIHKRLIVHFLLVLAMCFTSIHANAQFIGEDVLGDKDKIDIPFEMYSGFIVAKVLFKGYLELNMIFDTGAEHTILFESDMAKYLQLNYDQVINIYGSDLSQSVQAFIARQVPMRAGKSKRVYRDLVVLQSDSLQLNEITGREINGILGANFFKGLKVKINYKRKKITLYNSQKEIKGIEKYHQLPIEVHRFKPYLNVDIVSQEGEKNKLKVLLDTGAALGLMLHTNTSEYLNLPSKVIKGELGKGIGGNVEGYLGRIRKISFGDLGFNQVITSYQDIDSSLINLSRIYRNGIIGNILLSRFEVILDYVHGFVYLKPTKEYDKEFKTDRSGMSIYAFGEDLNQYYVRHVYEHSPAYEAGIRAGDIIKKIGWWNSKRYSLDRINNKLQGKVGKTIKMTMLREEEEIKVEFKLRDWFDEIPNNSTSQEFMATME